jgi:hypothetical protein
MRGAGYAARIGEKRNTYQVLVGKREAKSPLRKSRRRWKHNITRSSEKNIRTTYRAEKIVGDTDGKVVS